MATQPSVNPAQIALEARKCFVIDAGRMMTDIASAVYEHLTALMNETVRLRESQARRDAWDFYRKARAPWLDNVVSAWQKALLPPTASMKLDLTAENFQLLGTDVVEDKILASRLVRGAQDKLGSQLDDLKIRMRVLEGHAEFQDHDIFRPEVVILPIVEQWAVSGMQRDAFAFILDTVQRMLTDRLLSAYTQVNEYLIKQGVMPTIELKDRVKRVANNDPGQVPKPGFKASVQSEHQSSTFGIDSTGNYAPPVPSGRGGGYAAPQANYPNQPAPQYGGQNQNYPQGQPQHPAQPQQAPFGGRLGWGNQQGQPPGAGGPGGGGQADNVRGGAYRSSNPQGLGSTNPGKAQAPFTGQLPPAQPGQQGQAPQNQGSQQPMGSDRADQHYQAVHEETRMQTATTPLARARSRSLGVMGQLKRLLIGRVGPEAESTEYYRPSPGLAAALARRPVASGAAGSIERASGYGDGGTVVDEYTPAGVAKVAGRLREETAELKKKAETKNEKATIEIVALMFQAILQEERIPPGIRVWFSRLQMPVLRVALEEPDFFGTLNHPARLLIDRMGSCVMGFDASGVHGSAMETEVKRIVQVIEQYPETGKRVYQLVYEEFQKFLAKFLTEKGSTQKVVSVAQQVEQKETLTIQYTIEMRNMLKDIPVPDEIREFLFKVWAEVLAVAAVRKGPQAAETLDLKRCSSELVWSASAKPNRADRAKVIAELPKLLQRLRSGMTLLGLGPSVQDTHIKTVSDTLADAFMSKTKAVPQEQIDAMAKRLANLEDFVSEDGMGDLPLDAESIELMLGIDPSTIDVVADGGSKPNNAMVAWASELQLGAWFTLDHNSRVTKVQFAWRSDRKHLNLFASTSGHTYLIQAGRLAAYLQAGLLLPQEEETLTVRATRNALAKLEANPERLLS